MKDGRKKAGMRLMIERERKGGGIEKRAMGNGYETMGLRD